MICRFYYYFSTFLIEIVLSPQLDTHQAALIGDTFIRAFIMRHYDNKTIGVLRESRSWAEAGRYGRMIGTGTG